MKILSLDTAMAACSAAIVDPGKSLPMAEAFVPMERGHAEALPPMVAEVMFASGLDFADIDRIAVTIGPGTFTGVRIGLSFARGLGLARGIPVIGIDSLSAIAANETARRPLLVVSDARNDEVYAASFDAERRLLSGPHVTAAAGVDLPADALIIGTAARAVLAVCGGSGIAISSAGDVPVAANFARLAAAAVPTGMPAPLYLRAPDAKPQSVPLRKAGVLTIETVPVASAPLLAELHAEAFEEGWTAPAFEDLLRMPGASAVIARETAEPLAFVLIRRAADEAEIITIATRPQAQRRGVARRLIEAQIEELMQNGVRQMFLEVAASNTPALALYHALGFAEAGRRKGYYQRRHGREDAIVMRRDLAP